ncbi:related to short-chain dehydrogenase/reductase family protein, putative [Phialocephala subalpina]|uniref:Related to short-chain dehydrogenase/reductase family protein, putative n=1 Tax=Phialocephala subalpina TaxID=576137 RepID=A0A1L7WKX2_9HELO|nr:related to short-chain dehydrogenase/reductase family protein, putative [Phialocephala subalpina]
MAAFVASRDMPTLPEKFFPIFWNNQFRVKIELPTRDKYSSLEGKVAIITGANCGLGFESARQLLTLGLSHLVVAVRSIEKGKAAASKLRLANPSAIIDVWNLDMESYDSIQSFVRKCSTELPRIDYTILNAGIGPLNFSTTPSTGHETAIQVNHISTALLTILLLPVLKAKSTHGSPAQLTVVNSLLAHLAKFPNRDQRPLLPSFDDVNITPWDPRERYGVSKLLVQLFLVKLTEYIKPDDVIINMVDPGATKGTRLSRDVGGAMLIAVKIMHGVAARPLDRGAATYVDALLGHGKEIHGCFLMNCEISPLATFFYTAEGRKATEQIWLETMKELNFAHVEEIIASMK